MTKSSPQTDAFRARHLFNSAVPANISMIAGTALVSAYFYESIGHTLIIWIAAMCLIATARIFISQQFIIDQQNHFRIHTVQTWLKIYIASSLLFGCAGASLVLFMPETMGLIDLSVLYIIFFSTMAGSITTLPIVLPAYFFFTTPVFLAAISLSFLFPSTLTWYIGIASVIYFSFIIAAGQLVSRRYHDNFTLMIENELLIGALHDEIIQKELAQQELVNNSHKLEETVELRTRELADINDILVTEINERRRIEHNLKHVAHHDALTDLPNRLLLDARLNHAIERAKRSNLQVAVMFIDLDYFKTINDSLGHDVGDKLLVSVSKRLLHCVREGDTVARLGGDEFIIIIEQVHDIGDLDQLLKKIMKATSEIFTIDNHDLSTSASIGVCIYPDDGKNAEQLMRNADSAMYHVKENGRHKYHFYTRELTTTAYDRVILEADLKHAIENNELVVFYQPQISLQTKQLVGVEALVRWQHPDLGLLPPNHFLGIAEQTGVISQIGEEVLTVACKQMVEWKKRGLPIDTIAVNIAGDQIHHGNLINKVKNVLQKTQCKTEWLELEITEDFIIKKTKQAISTLQQLRDLGISLAIDDFGTGYSSLSYLKQLPINKLKIDRSFVKDINYDTNDAALIQAIIAMGKSLNLKLIAEGVENGSHEIFLGAHGCDYAQGYYYSKPVTADKIEALLLNENNDMTPKIKLVSKN